MSCSSVVCCVDGDPTSICVCGMSGNGCCTYAAASFIASVVWLFLLMCGALAHRRYVTRRDNSPSKIPGRCLVTIFLTDLDGTVTKHDGNVLTVDVFPFMTVIVWR